MRKKLIPVIVALIVVLLLGSWWLYSKSSPTSKNSDPSSNKQNGSNKQSTPGFDKKKFSTDDPASIWVVVNKKRLINPKDYVPTDLTNVGGGQQMRKEASTAFSQMVAAAKAEGLTLQPLSGYRSYQTQVAVYNKEVATYGQATADRQSAKPGTSEHQTGFAIDVGGGGCGIEDCFGKTAEGKWLAANAYKFGFIIRYTAEKEAVTGYRAEPWHIRYVGNELSNELHKTGVTTLEEFFGL